MSIPLVDAAGHQHSRVEHGARVLSLVPSLTELMFDLNLGRSLVGRTNFCVHPNPGVGAIPSVGGTKQIDMAKVAGLNPTHALVNIDETPKDMAKTLADMDIEIVVTHPVAVSDNLPLFRLIGGIFGAHEKAEHMVHDFGSALNDLRARNWERYRVLYLIWRKPWMSISADTYIADVLAQANWHVIEHQTTARYPEINLTAPLLAEVDLVLFSTEPFPFKRKHLETFGTEFPGHADKAHLIDAEMVSWYGSRAIAGLRYLADFAEEMTS